MIEYKIDEENKVITCIIGGNEVSNYLNKVLANISRDYKNSVVRFTDVKIKDRYVGTAKFHDTEVQPYDEKLGKKIARQKAFRKLNTDVAKKLDKVKLNVAHMQNKLFYHCQKYSIIADSINEKLSSL